MVATEKHQKSKKEKAFKCSGPSLCPTCFNFIGNDNYCPGCDNEYHQNCLKKICNFACHSCCGGKHAYTPGCCGRAQETWNERWKQLLEQAIPDYAPEPLNIRCRLIPIIHSVRKYKIPENFPEIDAWAVPIHMVANRKGEFKSNDLKDYLGLPPDRKLILSTYAPDDYQEMLWRQGPKIDYKHHGINYWFPGHFSIYDLDSKLYQFTSAKRQQFHAIWTSSQFVWFRLGEHIPVDFMSPIRNASSVLISTGQMYSPRNRAILFDEVRVADQWFPKDTTFFVIGGAAQLPLSNNRSCYEFNSTWLFRGVRGYNLARQLEMDIPKKHVLINNLKEVLKNVCTSES